MDSLSSVSPSFVLLSESLSGTITTGGEYLCPPRLSLLTSNYDGGCYSPPARPFTLSNSTPFFIQFHLNKLISVSIAHCEIVLKKILQNIHIVLLLYLNTEKMLHLI